MNVMNKNSPDFFYLQLIPEYKPKLDEKTKSVMSSYPRITERLKELNKNEKTKIKDKFNTVILPNFEQYNEFADFTFVKLTKEQRNQDFLFEYMTYIKKSLRLLSIEVMSVSSVIARYDIDEECYFELKSSMTSRDKVFKFNKFSLYEECEIKEKFNERVNVELKKYNEFDHRDEKQRKLAHEYFDSIDCD